MNSGIQTKHRYTVKEAVYEVGNKRKGPCG